MMLGRMKWKDDGELVLQKAFVKACSHGDGVEP